MNFKKTEFFVLINRVNIDSYNSHLKKKKLVSVLNNLLKIERNLENKRSVKYYLKKYT